MSLPLAWHEMICALHCTVYSVQCAWYLCYKHWTNNQTIYSIWHSFLPRNVSRIDISPKRNFPRSVSLKKHNGSGKCEVWGGREHLTTWRMEPNTPSVLLLLLYEFAFHLFSVSIGPLSDHCLALTLTEWLTYPYCWDLIVPSLSFEDTISKLVKEEKYNEIGKSSISRIRSEMTKNHWVCWLESLIQLSSVSHKQVCQRKPITQGG